MKCIVTGGAGFIGSNLVNFLIKNNYEVVVIDNEYSDAHETFYWNSSAKNYKLDIRDYENTKNLYMGVDYVFHIAAEARIQPAILNPINAVSINSVGTATVLQCSKEAGVKRVIYSSTSSAYGRNSIPNIENQPDDCLNPYSVSKVNGEKLCKMYYELYGLETVILRYFNVYGKNQPTKGKYASVIGLFLRQKLNNESLTIVGNGEQRRDFTNVKDVVNANYLAAFSDIEKKYFGTVFNVGTSKNYSVKEIANMISDKQVFIDNRPGEVKETLASINKIFSLLGWRPLETVENYIKFELQFNGEY
jgi:UDP-glucose 4-epimerase